MRYLLDKSVVRRCLKGLIGGNLSDDVRKSLRLLSAFAPDQLYISLQTWHILEHIVKVPHARLLVLRTSILYPVKYTKRWARRLREMGFGREDAYLLSLASFGTDQIQSGHFLGVHAFVTYDYRLRHHFFEMQPRLQTRLQRMTVQLSSPYHHAQLPEVSTPDQVLSH